MRILYDKNSSIVYEIPPSKRSYEYDNNFYFLQFPWMYIYVTTNTVFIYGSLEKVKSINDEVFVMPIGHNYDHGLCLGDNEIEDAPDCIFTNNDLISGVLYDCLEYLLFSGITPDISVTNYFFEIWQEDFGYFEIVANYLHKTELNRLICSEVLTSIWD